jgi:transcriptional regulator with XRE-family HTH domain
MATEALNKFAEFLSASREAKGITLQQIASRTKIDLKYLKAIESGNFGILPELYIRAFIKEYAQFVELDPDETIRKFDLAKKGILDQPELEMRGDAAEAPHPVPEPKYDTTTAPHLKSDQSADNQPSTLRKDYRIYIVAVSSAIAILILAYFLLFRNSADEILTEQAYKEAVTGERYELAKPKPEETFISEDDSLKLTITTNDRVWLKVLKDNIEVFRNFRDAKTTLNVRAFKEFRVVVGNAAFVSMKLNNKPLILVGKKGEIRNYIINADTVRSYLINIPKKNEAKPETTN